MLRGRRRRRPSRGLKRVPATGLAGARSPDPGIVFFKTHTRQRQKQKTRPFFLAVVGFLVPRTLPPLAGRPGMRHARCVVWRVARCVWLRA
jgi:hypothetical protein